MWSFSDNDSKELLSVSGKASGKASGSACGCDVSLEFVHGFSTQASLTILYGIKKSHNKHYLDKKEIITLHDFICCSTSNWWPVHHGSRPAYRDRQEFITRQTQERSGIYYVSFVLSERLHTHVMWTPEWESSPQVLQQEAPTRKCSKYWLKFLIKQSLLFLNRLISLLGYLTCVFLSSC